MIGARHPGAEAARNDAGLDFHQGTSGEALEQSSIRTALKEPSPGRWNPKQPASTCGRDLQLPVVRQFALVAVVWGVVGMAVGVLIAAQLVWPELNSTSPG